MLLFLLFLLRRRLVKNAKTNIRSVVWMLLMQRAMPICPFEKNARNLVDYAVQQKLFILITLIIYMLVKNEGNFHQTQFNKFLTALILGTCKALDGQQCGPCTCGSLFTGCAVDHCTDGFVCSTRIGHCGFCVKGLICFVFTLRRIIPKNVFS